MSRFIAPDLSKLPTLPLKKPDFEQTLEARLADFNARATAVGKQYNVSKIEADPIVINQRVGADREIEVRADHNDKVKSVLLSTAWGPYLDHIAATYYGISRLVEEVSDDGTKTFESDDDFRARIALAPEAFSTAGPEGAYIFHCLELDGTRDIVDVVAYSEEDEATYSEGLHADAFNMDQRSTPFTGRSTGDPVLAPEILLVILPDKDYGNCDQELLTRAYRAVTSKEVRPLCDNVRIEAPKIIEYEIEAVLKFAQGADRNKILEEAQKRVAAYIAARRRIGATIQRLGIGAAMKVDDVLELQITKPAADVITGSKGVGHCAVVNLTAEEGEATWRETP